MAVEKPEPSEGEAATAALPEESSAEVSGPEMSASQTSPEAETADTDSLEPVSDTNNEPDTATHATDEPDTIDVLRPAEGPADGDGLHTADEPDDADGLATAAAPDDADRATPAVEPSGPHRDDTAGVWMEPEEGRSRRSLLRALAALGIAVVSAVALGLLIVAFSKVAGDDSSKSNAAPPALTIPSSGGRAPASAVPADWVEQTTGEGVVFRAPPGWTERNDAPVDFRVEPSGSGPGVNQVGVGLVPGSTDANAEASNFVTNTYTGQPSFLQQPATDEVSARGERGRQISLTYSRSGTPVTVVVRAFPTPRGVLLVVSRGALADEQRAERLADALDASIRLP